MASGQLHVLAVLPARQNSLYSLDNRPSACAAGHNAAVDREILGLTGNQSLFIWLFGAVPRDFVVGGKSL